MLGAILLLSLVLPSLTDELNFSQKHGWEDCENLVEKLESRLRDVEIRLGETEARLESKDREMEMRLEQKNQEMETRLNELEEKMKEENELENFRTELEASTSKLKKDVTEESLRKEIASNTSNYALSLTKPSLRDLPIVLISAWQPKRLNSPQTVTFDSFLANYNNGDRPGGGDGVLDLDSGVFTCLTSGYYHVSFSAWTNVGPSHGYEYLYLYKNSIELPESFWFFGSAGGAQINDNFGVTGSRVVVSDCVFVCKQSNVKSQFPQILHMDAGDTLELRITEGDIIGYITLNIELIGLGFD